jgi:hypothetical protein
MPSQRLGLGENFEVDRDFGKQLSREAIIEFSPSTSQTSRQYPSLRFFIAKNFILTYSAGRRNVLWHSYKVCSRLQTKTQEFTDYSQCFHCVICFTKHLNGGHRSLIRHNKSLGNEFVSYPGYFYAQKTVCVADGFLLLLFA